MLDVSWPFTPLPRGAYGLIVADPPWTFATRSAAGRGKCADPRHYSCMSLAEIMALPVEELAAPDAALALWTTQNQIEAAYHVARAWGFVPKTLGAWAKRSRSGQCWQSGTGYLLRSSAEFYVIATRGRPKIGARNVRNLVVAPVREHSRKPDQFRDDIARLFPCAHRVELFARERADGWDCHGLECDRFEVA